MKRIQVLLSLLISNQVFAQSFQAGAGKYASTLLTIYFSFLPLVLLYAAYEMKTSEGGKKGKERVVMAVGATLLASTAVGIANMLRV